MQSNFIKIFSLLLLLLVVATQRVDAQFYKQNDSISRIIKRGVNRKAARLSQKQAVKEKSSKNGQAKRGGRKKSTKEKKESAKVVKSTKKVQYTGRKYRLGERVIMRGDSGNDVKAVANILVKKLFLEEKDIINTADGGVLYDGEIVRAVKLFQKVSDLYDDGMVGKPTLKALRRRE